MGQEIGLESAIL